MVIEINNLQTIDIKERITKTMKGVLKEILRMLLVIIVTKRDIMQMNVLTERNNKQIWRLLRIRTRNIYAWLR